jgi:hypothetical protein
MGVSGERDMLLASALGRITQRWRIVKIWKLSNSRYGILDSGKITRGLVLGQALE